jgi:hypothetical protein
MVDIEDFEVTGTPNANLWLWVDTDYPGPVKFKIKPGKVLDFSTGGRNEEGYSYAYHKYMWTGHRLYQELITDARDCDGQFETHGVWHTTDLHANQCQEFDDIDYPGNWKEVTTCQRDHEAEKAGY